MPHTLQRLALKSRCGAQMEEGGSGKEEGGGTVGQHTAQHVADESGRFTQTHEMEHLLRVAAVDSSPQQQALMCCT